MASKNARVEGLKELKVAFANSGDLVRDIGKKHIRHLAIWTVERTQRQLLNVGAVDTNELIQGMHYTLKTGKKTVRATVKPSKTADRYASAVEHGTKPHSAPISALQGWADRHGVPVGAVWYKIKTEGTEPRHFMRDTFTDTIREADNTARDIGNEFIRRI